MKVKSFIGHRLRELQLYPQILRGARAPKVLFFPSSTREGSSLLRVYNIADALAAHGWHAVVVPVQLELGQRERILRRFDPDLLVFQKCWHPYNDPDFAFGKPYVFDLDDADFLDAGQVDRIQRTVADARGVIAGSRYVAEWCREHNPNTTVIWTGTPVTDPDWPRTPHAARDPLVAWAQTTPLRYRAELEFVRTFLDRLAERGTNVIVRLYDSGAPEAREELQTLFAGHRLELMGRLAYDDFCRSLQDAALGLCPLIQEAEFSHGKSFGKILAYLDAKVPVLASDMADHGLFFTPDTGLVSNDMDAWLAYAETMLADFALRDRVAEAAFDLLQEKLSQEAAGKAVDAFLLSVLQEDKPQATRRES